MSEYQYYEFLALDRPLDERQLGELRALSTRAAITPTSFVNEYHWGDFRGDPRTLMRHYFDAHLYLADWGARRLMIRLPARLLDLGTAQQYCPGEDVEVWVSGEHVILHLTSEDESGDWDGAAETCLGSVIGIRAEIASGDLRPLYLAWLLAAQTGLGDDEPEPPVPPNLASLSAAQRGLAHFLRIEDDLLDVAAEASAQSGDLRPADLVAWIEGLSPLERDAALFGLLQGDDPHLRDDLRRRSRSTSTRPDTDVAPRTAGELLEAARERKQARERLSEQRRAQERARREHQRAEAREKHLDALALREETAWAEVSNLIDTKKPKDYDSAVALLADLRAISDRNGDAPAFRQRYQRLRAEHHRKPSLIERLDRARLDG